MRYFRFEGVVYAYDEVQIKEGLSKGKTELKKPEVESHLNRKPASPTSQEIDAIRIRSYADPINGSDRLFSESTRMQIMGESGHEAVREKAISRFKEIQAQYPWPTK